MRRTIAHLPWPPKHSLVDPHPGRDLTVRSDPPCRFADAAGSPVLHSNTERSRNINMAGSRIALWRGCLAGSNWEFFVWISDLIERLGDAPQVIVGLIGVFFAAPGARPAAAWWLDRARGSKTFLIRPGRSGQ
ncbi:hypothetical protein AB0G83_12080 [Streptomyces klenkii]|uniref:hypothetical protein n=1 Tax=Streptomyces klenkii TaxID=1420899 RepID=UPI0034072808